MSELKWGKWIAVEGKLSTVGEKGETPIRIMIQLPYDWHKTHTNAHVKKQWAAQRRRRK